MQRAPGPLNLSMGIDAGFFRRVYRTAGLLAVFVALMLWQPLGTAPILGWLLGACLSLGSLWLVEWAVGRVLGDSGRAVSFLMGVAAAKLVVVALLLAGLFWAALRGWVSLPWVLAGFAMPHLVIALKLVGQKVRALTAPRE